MYEEHYVNYYDILDFNVLSRQEIQSHEIERRKNRIKRRSRTFFTNTDNDKVPQFLTAAKFAGIKLKIYKNAYDIEYRPIKGLSAIHWSCKPTKRQRRLFFLYLDSFRYLHEDEIAKQSGIHKFYPGDLLGWYR